MAEMIQEKLSLYDRLRHEVSLYNGRMHQARLFPFYDEQNRTCGIAVVPDNDEQRPAWTMILAHVQDRRIIIEEDTAIDKPLYEALMKNAKIPREQIILAYQGETLIEK